MPTNNILYIGPYRQNDGWGLASRDYLLSLLTKTDSITAHPIYLSSNIDTNILDSISKLEKNRYDKYNTIIQHTLPFSMTKRGGYKNIGMLFLENQNFNSESLYNLESMDEIWVSSNIEKQNLEKAGISKPVIKVGHAINTSQINVCDSSLKFSSDISNNYKFYVVGEYIQRKNIKDIITAFHLEFDITEPVSLIIKTSLSGLKPNQLMQMIRSDCDKIKKSLRTRKYFHSEIIIPERLSLAQLNTLHKMCDCFVMASYGEAFCRPIAEALCHGNFCILSSNMGINEDIDSSDFYEIDCMPQPVILDNPEYIGNMDIYNGDEIWYQPSIVNLRHQMRQAFDNRPKVDPVKYLNRFSYQTIGEKLCQAL
jgi:glycosyltransferase involved in cell wall biosynthesis